MPPRRGSEVSSGASQRPANYVWFSAAVAEQCRALRTPAPAAGGGGGSSPKKQLKAGCAAGAQSSSESAEGCVGAVQAQVCGEGCEAEEADEQWVMDGAERWGLFNAGRKHCWPLVIACAYRLPECTLEGQVCAPPRLARPPRVVFAVQRVVQWVLGTFLALQNTQG